METEVACPSKPFRTRPAFRPALSRARPKRTSARAECLWGALALDSHTGYGHYAAWASGDAVGAAAHHIDLEGPNGDGRRPTGMAECSSPRRLRRISVDGSTIEWVREWLLPDYDDVKQRAR